MEVDDSHSFRPFHPSVPHSLPVCGVPRLFHMLFIRNNKLTPFPSPLGASFGETEGPLKDTERKCVCRIV